MPTEWIIVLVIGLLLLFSAKKLPDMARGLGQSMRIFKAETRGMKEDDQKRDAPTAVESAPAQPQAPAPAPAPVQATPVAPQAQTPAPTPVQAPAQDTTPDAARPGTTSS